MYRISDFTRGAYKASEVAKMLGLSLRTTYNYANNGKLKMYKTSTGRIMMNRDDLIEHMQECGLLAYDNAPWTMNDVIYARVPVGTPNSTEELNRQAIGLVERVAEIQNPIIIKDVGSSLDDQREGLNKMIELVKKHEVRNIYIAAKEVLSRFGYEYLEKICGDNGTRIIVVEGAECNIDKAREQEYDKRFIVNEYK